MSRSKNLVGQTFHRLTVLKQLPNKYIGKKKTPIANWLCQCRCGKKVEKTTAALKTTKSCGCLQKETVKARVQKIQPGNKYGFLTAIKFQRDSFGTSAWECKCFCGKTVIIRSYNLTKKRTKSCGCMQGSLHNETHYTNRPIEHQLLQQMHDKYKGSLTDAKRRKKEFTISKDHFFELLKAPCHYCGYAPKLEIWKFSDVSRIDNSEGYTYENCTSACTPCNLVKNTMSIKEFGDWLGRVTLFKKNVTFLI